MNGSDLAILFNATLVVAALTIGLAVLLGLGYGGGNADES